ncbi:MAG: hypothetical protein AAFR38_09075 [Planctomycetota bacterium]
MNESVRPVFGRFVRGACVAAMCVGGFVSAQSFTRWEVLEVSISAPASVAVGEEGSGVLFLRNDGSLPLTIESIEFDQWSHNALPTAVPPVALEISSLPVLQPGESVSLPLISAPHAWGSWAGRALVRAGDDLGAVVDAAGMVFSATVLPYENAYWVDFDEPEQGDGSRGKPFNSFEPFIFASAARSSDGFDGVSVLSNTVLRLRGKADALQGESLDIDDISNLGILPWADQQPWEIVGTVDVNRFPRQTAAERGDAFADVFSFDLTPYYDELEVRRGRDRVAFSLVTRGYELEMPGEPLEMTRVPEWQPGTEYKVGDPVKPVGGGMGYVYRACRDHVSGAVPPQWGARLGAPVDDAGLHVWDTLSPTLNTVVANDHFAAPIAGGLAELAASGAGYQFDEATKTLHVATPTGVAPGEGSEPEWGVRLHGTNSGFPLDGLAWGPMMVIERVRGGVLAGGRMSLQAAAPGLPSPRTLQMWDIEDFVIRDMVIGYSGDDSIAIVRGSPTNVVVQDTKIIAPGADTAVVVFTGGLDNVIEDVRVRDVEVHTIRPTGIGGGYVSLNQPGTSSAFAVHLGEAGALVRSVQFERCKVVGYGVTDVDRTAMLGFSPRDFLEPDGLFEQPEAHAVRFIDCEAYAIKSLPNIAGSFERCIIHFSATSARLGQINDPGALFVSSVITSDVVPPTGAFWMNSGPIVLRNSIIDVPIPPKEPVFAVDLGLQFRGPNAPSILLDRSVIDASGPWSDAEVRLVGGKFTQRPAPAGSVHVDGTVGLPLDAWIVGIGDLRVPSASPNAVDNLLPLGEHLPDSTIIDGVDPMLASGPLLDCLSLVPPDDAPVQYLRAGEANGIDGLFNAANTGHYGPFQRGAPGACNGADLAPPFGVLSANDVAAFVQSFLEAGPDADLAPPYQLASALDIETFVSMYQRGCSAGEN